MKIPMTEHDLRWNRIQLWTKIDVCLVTFSIGFTDVKRCTGEHNFYHWQDIWDMQNNNKLYGIENLVGKISSFCDKSHK